MLYLPLLLLHMPVSDTYERFGYVEPFQIVLPAPVDELEALTNERVADFMNSIPMGAESKDTDMDSPGAPAGAGSPAAEQPMAPGMQGTAIKRAAAAVEVHTHTQ